MVKRLKLNEKTLRDAEPKPGVSYQIFDTEVIGFAARVQASGARSKFDDIKFGRDRNFALSDIPIVPGALDFVAEIKRRGHSVAIVSDSHTAYVGPVKKWAMREPLDWGTTNIEIWCRL